MTLAPGEWVAAVGDINAGAEAAAEALAQLVLPTAGRIKIGEQQLEGMPGCCQCIIAYISCRLFLRVLEYLRRADEPSLGCRISQRHGDFPARPGIGQFS
jgi:hypothetical protein